MNLAKVLTEKAHGRIRIHGIPEVMARRGFLDPMTDPWDWYNYCVYIYMYIARSG